MCCCCCCCCTEPRVICSDQLQEGCLDRSAAAEVAGGPAVCNDGTGSGGKHRKGGSPGGRSAALKASRLAPFRLDQAARQLANAVRRQDGCSSCKRQGSSQPCQRGQSACLSAIHGRQKPGEWSGEAKERNEHAAVQAAPGTDRRLDAANRRQWRWWLELRSARQD